ncbi:type II secretion system F family protein, partial [Thioclava sp. BHET1]
MRKRRLDKIRRKFPDVLELLVITSDSGLGPIAALKRVVSALEGSDSALGEELRQFVIELSLLADPSVAYRNLEERVPLPEIQLFVTTMEQAERFGTSFSQAMRMLIRDQRAHILLRVEERAARIPATMTIPLILFIMPALFII